MKNGFGGWGDDKSVSVEDYKWNSVWIEELRSIIEIEGGFTFVNWKGNLDKECNVWVIQFASGTVFGFHNEWEMY